MRLRRRERQRRKGKEPGVIYASLGTRLYLFFPCELFYIGDLIKSNKSQCTHTHTHTHSPHNSPSWFWDCEHLLPANSPLHPRLNKSRLWCITRHIIHVVYRSKICKQTGGIKVIDAQMAPFFLFSSHLSRRTEHRHFHMSAVGWRHIALCPHTVPSSRCLSLIVFVPRHQEKPFLLPHPLKRPVSAVEPLLNLISSAKP